MQCKHGANCFLHLLFSIIQKSYWYSATGGSPVFGKKDSVSGKFTVEEWVFMASSQFSKWQSNLEVRSVSIKCVLTSSESGARHFHGNVSPGLF